MKRPQLAKRLLAAGSVHEVKRLLSANARIADKRLARELKELCYASWTAEPAAARRAARALDLLAAIRPETEILALSAWVGGIAEIAKGKLDAAVERLEEASRRFRKLGSEHESARPLVAVLIALGMLGRYSEAKKIGRKALGILEKYGDNVAAGKIEMNLSNIVSRLGKHREAERYCLSALRRFKKTSEPEWRAMAENGLANTYTELNEFKKAEKYFKAALETAAGAGMTLTVAEVESSLGNMALMRGRLDEALRFFELSRQKYETLRMPHQTAIAEMEIASIYAELNLTPEAAELYRRAAQKFHRRSLYEEEARSRIGLAKTASRQGNASASRKQFETAARLLEEKGNKAGATLARLEQAILELRSGRSVKAAEIVRGERRELRRLENPRFELAARLIEAQGALAKPIHSGTGRALTQIVERARELESLGVELAAINALGDLAKRRGDLVTAEDKYLGAIGKIEASRGRLQAGEFRMSFLAANLEPFEKLVEVYLERGEIERAFVANERFRSRSLAETSAGRTGFGIGDTKLSKEAETIREELNWHYRREGSENHDRSKKRAFILEKRLAGIERKLASTAKSSEDPQSGSLDLATLRKQLGANSALIEFFELNGLFSAFVVTAKSVELAQFDATPGEIQSLIEELRFTFGSLRYGGETMRAFAGQLKERTDDRLRRLHEKLIDPVAQKIEEKNLIFVPAGVLNYVPFSALFDGTEYLVEKCIVSYSPSAAVWQRLRQGSRGEVRRALLFAYADESIPLAKMEAERIAALFPGADVFTGGAATFENFRSNLRGHDLIHMACHGTYRSDNPSFSSLHLADGRVTVGDVVKERIDARLVTLSACETGLSTVYAGNEILGLVRGFLSAGARSLVASLWNINDSTSADLMTDFYSHLQRGTGVAASLREAQIKLIGRGENPYYWAPFFAIE